MERTGYVPTCRCAHGAANQRDDGPFDDVRVDDLDLAIACAARVEQFPIKRSNTLSPIRRRRISKRDRAR